MFSFKLYAISIAILLLFISCAQPVPAPDLLPPLAVPAQKPQPPIIKYKSVMQCDERTENFFNSSGIEVLPFIRVVFYDINGDGVKDMIAGSKDGSLRLYVNSGTRSAPRWLLDADYFAGVSVGAFSAPTAGDIDGDEKPEILVGTGGFSKESGKVIFYKNSGTPKNPVWKKMDLPAISVGNDATPSLFDIDNDGKPDLIVGNSTGHLFLFRNKSNSNKVLFVKDTEYFKGIDLGMYVVPAVTSYQNRIVIIAGNSMGKLSLIDKSCTDSSAWQKTALSLSISNFAAPAFIENGQFGIKDMVISDSNGQLTYYRNTRNDYRTWEITDDLFKGRTITGLASTPVITELNGSSFLVIGNINGEIRLFTNELSSSEMTWREQFGFFKGIKLSSFSRGILTEWEGHSLLITSQQDGIMRAFLNTGSLDKPSWSEKKQFFKGIPKIRHAAPAVFDIDSDGKFELIIGGFDGYVKGFKYENGKDGSTIWHKIDKLFDYAKVDGYASPSLARQEGKTYLFVGQQDGEISIFTADPQYWRTPVFYPDDHLLGVHLNKHSAPSALLKNGVIGITIGDYNGNLKQYACRKSMMEVEKN
ncbi:MAG: hypothetical protein A2X59_07720 [Nitrospirae bacterium GWC2_42_7]|nr:MAG: hypothetical protein A2X59_07720 [Nitrospirae bacterium GWC2_42_7]